MDHLVAVLADLPRPFTTANASAAGITQRVLERLVRRHFVTAVRRGVFLPTRPGDTDLAPWAKARLDYVTRVRAALLAHPGHAASHDSAAVLFGWPVLLHAATLVHLTALEVQPRSRRTPGARLHHSDSIVNDAVTLDSLVVLSQARTVADCLRTMYPAKAVAVADVAVRAGAASTGEVRAVLDQQSRWRGRPRALTALELVDGRRETWLESYSFAEMAGHGVEPPTPQVEIFDEYGRFVGRVDGMWVGDGTVAEADGRGKYALNESGVVDGSHLTAVARVLAEKAREDDLRGLGLELVRWDTEEIQRRTEAVVRRVERARGRGDIARFTGRLRVDGRWLPTPGHPAAGGPAATEHRPAPENGLR